MPRILLVEDETSIAETLIYALETEHYTVNHVSTAGNAIRQFSEGFDFVILDVGLPDMSGFDLCNEIRKTSKIPILFLTARNSEIDRILGLELGGDDYVTKPFSPREVVTRVRAILRRAGITENSQNQQPSTAMTDNRLHHETEAMLISFRGQAMNLTAHEYKLLAALMSQPGRIFSREQLLIKAWDDPGSAMDRTVDAHIKSLRAKIRSCSETNIDPIETRRGLGYTLNPDFI